MLAKDVVDSALNVTFCVNLSASLSQESVLVAIQRDSIITLLSIIGRKSDGLRSFPVSILDIYVVEFGV